MSTFPRALRAALLPVAVLALGSAAGAQMLGQTMDAEWVYPSFGATIEQHTFVVSAGVELPATTIVNDTKFDIDLDDDTIEFRFNATSNWTASGFNGWLFRDTNGTLPQITGYSIDAQSSGISTGTVITGFNDDECWANFGGMTVSGGGEWIRMKVHFGPSGPTVEVASGAPGGTMSFDFSDFTPGGLIAVVYGPAGSYTAPGGACAGLTVDLQPLNFPPVTSLILLTADGSGAATLTQGVPGAAAGLSVQAADVGSCTASNVVVL